MTVPRWTYPRLSWRVATALNRLSFLMARSTVLPSSTGRSVRAVHATAPSAEPVNESVVTWR